MQRFLPYWYTFLSMGIFIFACTFMTPLIGYRAVGFLILFGVTAIASLASLGPSLLAAALGALSWNFFFVPPKFTLTVAAPEDVLMFLTLFVVATTVAVMATRLKEAEKLRRSEELHQTLLNSISHELRTPLTVVVASATSMCDPQIAKNENAIKAIQNELLGASDRLNRVIENLLDMSRLNSGVLSIKPEWHDLHDVIGVAVSKLKIPLQNHRVQIDVKSPLSLVQMDFRLIEHALSNLILNAAQYSPSGTSIFVQAKVENSKLQIVVEDEGAGIPENSLAVVFEKFYRVPGSPAGGTGLGLSIVKGIIEAHNGSVKAELNTPRGTRFIVELPYQRMKDLEGTGV